MKQIRVMLEIESEDDAALAAAEQSFRQFVEMFNKQYGAVLTAKNLKVERAQQAG